MELLETIQNQESDNIVKTEVDQWIECTSIENHFRIGWVEEDQIIGIREIVIEVPECQEGVRESIESRDY
jgi:hypothetical protein